MLKCNKIIHADTIIVCCGRALRAPVCHWGFFFLVYFPAANTFPFAHNKHLLQRLVKKKTQYESCWNNQKKKQNIGKNMRQTTIATCQSDVRSILVKYRHKKSLTHTGTRTHTRTCTMATCVSATRGVCATFGSTQTRRAIWQYPLSHAPSKQNTWARTPSLPGGGAQD